MRSLENMLRIRYYSVMLLILTVFAAFCLSSCKNDKITSDTSGEQTTGYESEQTTNEETTESGSDTTSPSTDTKETGIELPRI
ncbi:MAG: hypothetical protein ACI3XQ_10690 [Eubacteriales bacterium]